MIRFSVLVCAVLCAGHAAPAPADSNPQVGQQVLARYFAALNKQKPQTLGIEMDMDFSARLPKMKKEANLLGRRIVSSLGKISFIVKSITGDNTVKTHVIAKYLAGEQDMSQKTHDADISPKNYKFKYKRPDTFNGRNIHVFELSPHKKRVGLFKGELWIDDETGLPAKEAGQMVKNPSVFLKKVNFTRTYAFHEAAALPIRVEWRTETRIAGPAELDIRYSNFGREGETTAQFPANAGER